MANVNTEGSGGGGKHGKKRAKKGSVYLDMTPMVDLAFLLITFFMLATTLSKPKTTELIYPKELDKDDTTKTKLADELAFILLLGEEDEHVFYYTGKFKPDTTVMIQTNFSKDGLRKILFDKNKRINDQVVKLRELFDSKQVDEEVYKEEYSRIVGDSLAPFVIIKTIEKSKWKNVINAMDELNITNVKKRAIQDMAESEDIALRQRIAELGL
ncbi:MAG: biopolymer transporter ExbD [Flavobacteriales bacterium]|nr:biopolymer transporter ExbD [Flavobacteriales bacterium]